jgi:diguanylate cyclase (GGDEF)-like protein
MTETDEREHGSALASAWSTLQALFRRPSRSLTSRITSLVFASTLVTSLAVTWLSVQTMHSFLAGKIDQKFPALVKETREQLEIWYSQRRLDIETFARSETIVDNLAELARTRGRGAAPRQEVAAYLRYVRERFDPYHALFLLDAGGRLVLWSGTEVALPDAMRERLAGVRQAGVGAIWSVGGRREQITSAPVRGRDGAVLGSLHALLRLDAVERLLAASDLSEQGRVSVVARSGEYLLSNDPDAVGTTYGRALPVRGARPQVEDYRDTSGRRVVSCSGHFEAFDWAIVVEEPYAEAFAPVMSVIRRILAIDLAIVLGLGLLALRIAISVVRPVKALSRGALRVAEGETDVVVLEPSTADEIGLLARTFNKMTARLHRNRLELQQSRLELEAAYSRQRAQNEELQRANHQLEQLSSTDDLTKLYNHRWFQEQLAREAKRALRTREPLALVLIDIDDFKRLNDRHGHAAGDGVLREVARAMATEVRETDFLARYGGEEFALLAPQTDLAGAVGLAEKLRAAVSRAEFFVDGDAGPTRLSVTVSIGVALFKGERQTLFNEADRALYRAKASGKDCVQAEG